MLKGLITSLLVSMGVVSPTTNTPSFIHNQQRKNVNENRETYDLDIDLYGLTKTNAISYKSGDNQDMNDMHINTKTTTSYYDDTLNVRVNQILSQVSTPDNNDQYGNFFFYSRANQKYNFTCMTMLRITPYRNVLENELNLRIETNIFPTYQITSNITLQTKIVSTINTSASTYIDEQNWSLPYRNTTIYEQITSSENGYTYNEQIFSNTITQQSQNADLEANLQIVNGKTNYIFIYQYLQNNDLYSYVNHLSTQTATWADIDEININGYFIPPISTYEVVDIPGLAFTILTMPFSFISTAFNLTLFPGTPYEINISQLFLAIIAILIFIWIIKKLIEAKMGM